MVSPVSHVIIREMFKLVFVSIAAAREQLTCSQTLNAALGSALILLHFLGEVVDGAAMATCVLAGQLNIS